MFYISLNNDVHVSWILPNELGVFYQLGLSGGGCWSTASRLNSGGFCAGRPKAALLFFVILGYFVVYRIVC